MKADIIGIDWVEFTVRRMKSLEVRDETIRGKKIRETENTVTVQYLWDCEYRIIVLEK